MIAKVFSKKDEVPAEPEPAPEQDPGPVYIPKPRNPAEVSVNLRPGNLPPKSDAEAEKHNSELSKMNQLYRQKLQKEAKAKALRRQKDLERQEEENKQREQKRKLDLAREQRLEEATQEWLRDIVPNWENKRYASRARDLVWKMGIPPQVRGKIWPMCIGNALMITQELYGIFAQHANNARTVKRKLEQEMKKEQSGASSVASRRHGGRSSSHAQSTHRGDDGSPNGSPRPSTDADTSSLSSDVPSSRGEPSLTEDDDSAAESPAVAPVILGKEATFSYIDVDLSRTFPTLAFFQEDCAMHRHLRDVLETFCFYRPDIGYVQGMSYLAGNLLLYMDPYAAFVCFANLLNSPFFHVFLKLDVERMNARYEVYNQIFKEHLPKLYRHFEENGVTPDLYFMEWCMTLFTKRLALDVVGRIWDCYLVFGEAFVYRTAVGILSALESKLIEQPFEQILKSLTTLPQNVGEKEMFDHIAPIKLSQSMKEKLANIERMRKK